MSECLPDLPRYIRQRGDEWQGADHPGGPWRPIPAPQSGLPWPVPPTVQSTPLSPAAQAVLDAYRKDWTDEHFKQDDKCLAAALRAVADQVDAVNVPDHIRGDAYWSYRNGRAAAKAHLIAIADELEGFNG
jgi:hypothetical protein